MPATDVLLRVHLNDLNEAKVVFIDIQVNPGRKPNL